MNKPVYLGLSTLEISKKVMYEFWYGYVKPKYGGRAQVWYMDIDSFIALIKTEGIYTEIPRRCWSKIWYYKLWKNK